MKEFASAKSQWVGSSLIINNPGNDVAVTNKGPIALGGPFILNLNLSVQSGAGYVGLNYHGNASVQAGGLFLQSLDFRMEQGFIQPTLFFSVSGQRGSSVTSIFPKIPIGTPFSVVFDDNHGKKFAINDGNGKTIVAVDVEQASKGAITNGLFPDGNMYPVVQVFQNSQMTLSQFDFRGTPDGKLYLADVDTSKLTSPYIAIDNVDQITQLRIVQVPQDVLGMAISPDSTLLAVRGLGVSYDSGKRQWTGTDVRVVNIETGDVVRHFRISDQAPVGAYSGCIDFSPDGSALFATFGEVNIFNTKTGESIGRMEGVRISCGALSPDGRLYATGSGGESGVRLWDTATRKVQSQLNDPDGSVNYAFLKFTPDGKFLLADYSRYDQAKKIGYEKLLIWDVSKNVSVGQVGQIPRGFSPDGTKIIQEVVENKNHVLLLWDWKKNQEIQRFKGLTAYSCNNIVFSADGSLIAAGSEDGQLLLWDVKTGQELRRWENFGSKFFTCDLTISSRGNYIALSDYDDNIRIFGLK